MNQLILRNRTCYSTSDIERVIEHFKSWRQGQGLRRSEITEVVYWKPKADPKNCSSGMIFKGYPQARDVRREAESLFPFVNPNGRCRLGIAHPKYLIPFLAPVEALTLHEGELMLPAWVTFQILLWVGGGEKKFAKLILMNNAYRFLCRYSRAAHAGIRIKKH